MPFLTNTNVTGMVSYFTKNNHEDFQSFRLKTDQNQGSTTDKDESTIIVITVEANENTPLLGGSWKQKSTSRNYSKKHNDNKKKVRFIFIFRVLGTAVLLVGGLTMCTYFPAQESRIPSAIYALDLINLGFWTVTPLIIFLNDSKIVNVLTVHTKSEMRSELYCCIDVLRNMDVICLTKNQIINVEIIYNFPISSDDDQIYEVREWNHESIDLLLQQSSMVIGCNGNYTFNTLTDVQYIIALPIVNESMQRKPIDNYFYQVFGLRNLSRSYFEGKKLLNAFRSGTAFLVYCMSCKP